MNLLKKIFFFFILLVFPFNNSHSEELRHRFGIKLAPSGSFFHINGENCTALFSWGFNAGISGDFILKMNHTISTGLFYSVETFKIKHNNENYNFNVKYLNIPALFKFYTNEIWLDTQFFLFSGLIFSFKLLENTPEIFSEKKNLFNILKLGFTLGGGLEYEIAHNTSVFSEIGYKTDIFSSISNKNSDKTPLKKIFAHTIFLSIGMRF